MSKHSELSTEIFEAGVAWGSAHKLASLDDRKAAAAATADPEAFLDGINDEVEGRTQAQADEWLDEQLYGNDD